MKMAGWAVAARTAAAARVAEARAVEGGAHATVGTVTDVNLLPHNYARPPAVHQRARRMQHKKTAVSHPERRDYMRALL